jgi:hypothetical protein
LYTEDKCEDIRKRDRRYGEEGDGLRGIRDGGGGEAGFEL